MARKYTITWSRWLYLHTSHKGTFAELKRKFAETLRRGHELNARICDNPRTIHELVKALQDCLRAERRTNEFYYLEND